MVDFIRVMGYNPIMGRFRFSNICLECGGKVHARGLCKSHYRKAMGQNKTRYQKVKNDPEKLAVLKRSVANYRKTDRYKEVKSRLDKKYYQQNKNDIQEYRKEFNELERFGRRREEILNRDGNKCTLCLSENNLVIHHKDGEGRKTKKPNNELTNLITLCKSCHMKVHNPSYLKEI
jgi:5-methylcytosine-specific restriction endonuclease McrA